PTTGAQQHLVPLVGLPRVAEAGELPNRPGPSPVAGRVEPAGVRELARPPDALEAGVVDAGRRTVHRLDRHPGQRGEVRVALAGGIVPALPALAAGGDLLGVHRGIPSLARSLCRIVGVALNDR